MLLQISNQEKYFSFLLKSLKLIIQGKYSLIPFTVEKGELGYFYCEIFFDFRENLINFNFKLYDKVLEPSFVNIAALKPVSSKLERPLNQNREF